MFSCLPHSSQVDIARAFGPAIHRDCVCSTTEQTTGTSGFFSVRAPSQTVQAYQRKQLLERVDREGATVGAAIPEEIDVQGESIDLQSFVFEIKRRETVPAGERDRVETAKRNLRRERLQRRQRLEEDDISYEEGRKLADAIVGLDRALEALESLGSADLEQEKQVQEAADQKRWMSFLQKALGHEDADSGTGRAGRFQ